MKNLVVTTHKTELNYQPNHFASNWSKTKEVTPNQFLSIAQKDAHSCYLYKDGKRAKVNVLKAYCIILDFDEVTTIEQFKDSFFKDYDYILYPSRSHQIAKKNKLACDRFHVLVPFTEPLNNEQLDALKKPFVKLLKESELNVDSSIFTVGQYIFPSRQPNSQSTNFFKYVKVNETGKQFNAKLLNASKTLSPVDQPLQVQNTVESNLPGNDSVIEKVESKVDQELPAIAPETAKTKGDKVFEALSKGIYTELESSGDFDMGDHTSWLKLGFGCIEYFGGDLDKANDLSYAIYMQYSEHQKGLTLDQNMDWLNDRGEANTVDFKWLITVINNALKKLKGADKEAVKEITDKAGLENTDENRLKIIYYTKEQDKNTVVSIVKMEKIKNKLPLSVKIEDIEVVYTSKDNRSITANWFYKNCKESYRGDFLSEILSDVGKLSNPFRSKTRQQWTGGIKKNVESMNIFGDYEQNSLKHIDNYSYHKKTLLIKSELYEPQDTTKEVAVYTNLVGEKIEGKKSDFIDYLISKRFTDPIDRKFFKQWLSMVTYEFRKGFRPVILLTGVQGSGKDFFTREFAEATFIDNCVSEYEVNRQFTPMLKSKLLHASEFGGDAKNKTAVIKELKKISGRNIATSERKGIDKDDDGHPCSCFPVLTSNEFNIANPKDALTDNEENRFFVLYFHTPLKELVNKTTDIQAMIDANGGLKDFLYHYRKDYLFQIYKDLLQERKTISLRFGLNVPETDDLKELIEEGRTNKQAKIIEFMIKHCNDKGYMIINGDRYIHADMIKKAHVSYTEREGYRDLRLNAFKAELLKAGLIPRKPIKRTENKIERYVYTPNFKIIDNFKG